VTASELIARYILSKSHFRPSDRTVKYGAYLPAPDGETSVYRTSSLTDTEVWDIGREHVAKPSGRTLYARGDTTAAVMLNNGLTVTPETTPHPLHANIANWPPEKHEQKMLAVQIANEAMLVMPPG
jgi:hypothetical protein